MAPPRLNLLPGRLRPPGVKSEEAKAQRLCSKSELTFSGDSPVTGIDLHVAAAAYLVPEKGHRG